VLVLLCACGRVGFDPLAASSDAPPIGDANGPLGPFGAFGEPVVQTNCNSTVRDYGVTISPDGLEIMWSSYRSPSSGQSDLWSARRIDRTLPFDNPKHISALSSSGDDGEPSLGYDGRTVYFDHYLPNRIQVGTRATPDSDTWMSPMSLEMPDLYLLGYGGSDLGPGDVRLVLIDETTRAFYECTRPDPTSPWGPPQLLVGLGTDPTDGFPSLRGDGLEIFFESSRSGIQHIWHAERPALDMPFGPTSVVSLGATDAASAGDPDISADGQTLVFVSNLTGGTGEYDIYVANRDPL
jgi:Tol biopolymer transport system component